MGHDHDLCLLCGDSNHWDILSLSWKRGLCGLQALPLNVAFQALLLFFSSKWADYFLNYPACSQHVKSGKYRSVTLPVIKPYFLLFLCHLILSTLTLYCHEFAKQCQMTRRESPHLNHLGWLKGHTSSGPWLWRLEFVSCETKSWYWLLLMFVSK